MKIKLLALTTLNLISLLFLPTPISAQGGIDRTIEIPYVVGFSTLEELINTAFRWGTFFAMVAAVFYLIYGGLRYTTAGSDPEKAQDARQIIVNAIIGVVIVSSVYLALQLLQSIIPGLGEIIVT